MERFADVPAYISLSRTSSRDITSCKRRVIFFTAVFTIVLIGIAGRTLYISSDNAAAASYTKKDNKAAAHALVKRRTLTDRNGTALALNVFTASVHANPRAMPDKEQAIRKLAKALPDIPHEKLHGILHKDRSYVWLKRHLTPKEEKAVNEAAVAGVSFKADEQRVYPYKNLFSHTLGYVDVDGRGIAGAERFFNNHLARPSTGDDSLALSVDIGIQHAVRDVLGKRMKEFNAKAASAIVSDVRTGEILSMVSLPDFDPNAAAQASSKARFNIATLGVYEPGSVFKLINNGLVLKEQVMSLHQKLDVSDPLKVGKFTIRDYHREKEPLDITEILMKSSNIGSAKMVLNVKPDAQKAFFKALGLLDSTSIELSERGAPLTPRGYGPVYRATLSYGHGIAVTPVHVMQAASAMINGGILYPATLVKQRPGSVRGTRVINEKTSKRLRRMLRLTAEFGTGRNADVPHYLVGGKTGTADKAKGGRYGDRRVITSFYAAFPMHAPRYAVYVMLDEPFIDHKYIRATGGNTAAPAAGDIIRRVAPMLDVTPVDEGDSTIRRLFEYKKSDGTDARA